MKIICRSLPVLTALLLLGQSGDEVDVSCETVSGIQACPISSDENGVAAFNATNRKEKVDASNNLVFSGNVSSALDQIVAFRRRRTPALRTNVVWPSAPIQALTYPATAEIPLRVWIICGTMVAGACAAPSQQYLNDLNDFPTHANFRLQYERVGVRLSTSGNWLSDVTGGALDAWKDFQGESCGQFEAAARNTSPPTFQQNSVNVYIVETVDTYQNYGLYCDPSDIVVVANTVSWDVMLHETGHVLTLQDLPVSGFGAADSTGNYMVSAPGPSGTREFFTEGQTFRVHFNALVSPPSLMARLFPGRMSLMRSCGSTNEEAAHAIPPCPREDWRLWADQ